MESQEFQKSEGPWNYIWLQIEVGHPCGKYYQRIKQQNSGSLKSISARESAWELYMAFFHQILLLQCSMADINAFKTTNAETDQCLKLLSTGSTGLQNQRYLYCTSTPGSRCTNSRKPSMTKQFCFGGSSTTVNLKFFTWTFLTKAFTMREQEHTTCNRKTWTK